MASSLDFSLRCPPFEMTEQGFSDRLLAKLATLHSVNEMVIEANYGDDMFLQLFKPVLRAPAQRLTTGVPVRTGIIRRGPAKKAPAQFVEQELVSSVTDGQEKGTVQMETAIRTGYQLNEVS